MKLNRKNKKGFTIVELVIVIAVIGILAAILIPTFTNLTKNAQESAKKQTVGDAYTLYLAEAVDGKYDNLFLREGDGPQYTYVDARVEIANKKQSEVVMKYKDEYFTYSLDKGWENKGKTAPTGIGDLVCNPFVAADKEDGKTIYEESNGSYNPRFVLVASADDAKLTAANEQASTFNTVIVYTATVNA